MKTKHTPTPLTVIYDEFEDQGNHCVIYDYGHGSVTIARVYKKENATFIVRTCNSHDELVSALALAKEFFDDYCGDIPTKTLSDKIDNALAKAKGE